MDSGSLAQLVIFVSSACCELTRRRAVVCNILSAHSHRHDDFCQPFISSAKQHMYVSEVKLMLHCKNVWTKKGTSESFSQASSEIQSGA